MKTSLVPFTALAFFFSSIGSAGCGIFSEPDSVLPVDGDPNAPVRPSAPPPLEGTPKTSEIDESFAVFIVADAARARHGDLAHRIAGVSRRRRERHRLADALQRKGAEGDGKSGPITGPWCNAPSCVGFPIALAGGEGGKSTCGYEGGTGGSGGVWQSVYSPQALRIVWSVYENDAATAGGFIPEGFIPADGTRGKNGSGGRAGSGGGGFAPIASPDGQNIWHGIAGTEGKGGGASVAAFVVDGAVAFVGSELVAKSGGAGGKGTFGSTPTSGGKGGPMIAGVPPTQGEDGTPGAVAGISGSWSARKRRAHAH